MVARPFLPEACLRLDPWSALHLLRMKHNEKDRRESEQPSEGGKEDSGPVRETYVVATRERSDDASMSEVSVRHEGDTDDCESDSDDLERPARPAGQFRDEPSCAEAHCETRQASPPPREIGPFVRKLCPSRRVARLIDLCGHPADFGVPFTVPSVEAGAADQRRLAQRRSFGGLSEAAG